MNLNKAFCLALHLSFAKSNLLCQMSKESKVFLIYAGKCLGQMC